MVFFFIYEVSSSSIVSRIYPQHLKMVIDINTDIITCKFLVQMLSHDPSLFKKQKKTKLFKLSGVLQASILLIRLLLDKYTTKLSFCCISGSVPTFLEKGFVQWEYTGCKFFAWSHIWPIYNIFIMRLIHYGMSPCFTLLKATTSTWSGQWQVNDHTQTLAQHSYLHLQNHEHERVE